MKRAPLVLLFVLIVGGLTAGLWWSQQPVAEDPAAADEASSGALPDVTPVADDTGKPGEPAFQIRSGGRLELDTAQLPKRIQLGVPELERKVEAQWVKVTTREGKLFELPADTSIEVTAELFPPGDYLIQMRTNELSPLPLRRYVLTVR